MQQNAANKNNFEGNMAFIFIINLIIILFSLGTNAENFEDKKLHVILPKSLKKEQIYLKLQKVKNSMGVSLYDNSLSSLILITDWLSKPTNAKNFILSFMDNKMKEILNEDQGSRKSYVLMPFQWQSCLKYSKVSLESTNH